MSASTQRPSFRSLPRRFALLALVLGALAAPSRAHSVWLLEGPGGAVRVVFGEGPHDSSTDMLDLVEGTRLVEWIEAGAVVRHELQKGEEAWTAAIPARAQDSTVFAQLDYGIMERDKTFLLRYFAKTLSVDENVDCASRCGLDIASSFDHDAVTFRVRCQGKPAVGATIVLYGDEGLIREESSTDENGNARFSVEKPGAYWVRARHVQDQTGTHKGEEYEEIRNYCTATLDIPAFRAADRFPDLPESTTSFGAAIAGGYLYTYGGHTGRPHQYSRDDQSDHFRRISVKNPTEWETLPSGPKLQGLAMVAHNGMLYRLGGFTALNAAGEEGEHYSQDGFARFDPILDRWEELDPMPVPRSSFDAVVIGDLLYIAGGWHMTPAGSEWLTSAFVADLRAARPKWTALPEAPFARRAMSLGEQQGKLVVVGGMCEIGGPTTEVSFYDPQARTWSEGPELPVEGRMAGFGSSSFLLGARLHATGYDGSLLSLSADTKAWEKVGGLGEERFFHRMLPLDDERLLVIGGASMSLGSYSDLVVLHSAKPIEASAPNAGTEGE